MTDRSWMSPDLPAYREHLLERGLAPSTVNSHLFTIRGRYKALLADGSISKHLQEAMADTEAGARTMAIQRVEASLWQELKFKSVKRKNPSPRKAEFRLTYSEIRELLRIPQGGNLLALRDTAILNLLFTTGIRATELCALEVQDLQGQEGQALHIPDKPGCVERFVPYGQLKWGLEPVQWWLEETWIESGSVFRGFYKGGYAVRSTPLSIRALENIVTAYPVSRWDGEHAVRPMDWRKAHTRLLFEAGVELDDLKALLGLKDSAALVSYIGGKGAALNLPEGDNPLDKSTWWDT